MAIGLQYGENFQSDLSSQLDMPILQDEVDLTFFWVKKSSSREGWYLLSNDDC